jgi:transposase
MEELITLTMEEQKRYEIIKDSLKKRIKVKEASYMLGISIRQVYRLRRRVKEEGIKGIIHRLRGKPSFKRLSKEIEDKIKGLYKKKYFGFNISHFTEYLNEEEGIEVSREYVRRLLREEDIYPKKPKRQPKHRSRREPVPQEGLLSQLDTSEHSWLKNLDKNCYLILLIDDATNKIQNAKFVSSDTTIENMKVLEEFFKQKGLPSAIYLDKDAKFKTTRYKGVHYNIKGEPYKDTQIRRALSELGITLIYADSPQAKGRIERDFQTLQDRLINELKLHKITTIPEANHYLKEEFIPKWNKKFAREPKIKKPAYRRIPKDLNLSLILCIKEERTVYPDNTISYKGIKYQILADPYRASYAKTKVEVLEHLDGKISILYKERKLKYRKIGSLKNHKEEEHSLEEKLLFARGEFASGRKGDISILQKR